VRLSLYSFDVIHSLGFYSFGIKIDAIPGRINTTNTLRLLLKGEYNGFRYELCGQGHLSMMLLSLILF
jgi:heme/copper-type cytochrome/quinol oxidase subunit 2